MTICEFFSIPENKQALIDACNYWDFKSGYYYVHQYGDLLIGITTAQSEREEEYDGIYEVNTKHTEVFSDAKKTYCTLSQGVHLQSDLLIRVTRRQGKYYIKLKEPHE